MNCHFCHQPIPKVPGRLQVCNRHPHKIIHTLDKWGEPQDKPFSITIRLQTLKLDLVWKPEERVFRVWKDEQMPFAEGRGILFSPKLLLELDKFPSQLTPENAEEEILFYLTFS